MGASEGDEQDDHTEEEVRAPLVSIKINLQNTPATSSVDGFP